MSNRPDLAQQMLPAPRSIRRRDGFLRVGPLRPAAERLPTALIRPALDYLIDRCHLAQTVPSPEASTSDGDGAEIRFELAERLPTEGYELVVEQDFVLLRASSRRGFFYAATTLRQWLELHSPEGGEASVPCVEIEDRPDFRHRGFLLDVSRNKVPKLTSLMRIVDRLADLKLNEFQIYMEHTFAYSGHEQVWRDASPLTADDIQQLDGYCRLRCIELVPNQNSFGHFHQWLKHPAYQHLAECPEGVEHPFSDNVEPFSLCPTDPASLDLLRDLYRELLPNFTSGRFHVGFDETLEIGTGRSSSRCAEVGLDQVYLARLEAVRKLAAEHNRRIQIWADMVLEHRGLGDKLPDDVVLSAWGYEADHPFREDCAFLAATNCELHVCPGTSSWTSFAGRAGNALANLADAASAGLAAGATGYLITDWGDRGHLQPLSASYLGLAAGAAFAWHRTGAKRHGPRDWAPAIDRWLLGSPDCGLGEAAIELANAYQVTGASQKNGTALFHLLMSPDDGLETPRYRGLSHSGLAETRQVIASAKTRIARAKTRSPGARRTRDELLWVADTLALACAVGEARLESPLSELADLPSDLRKTLGGELAELAERRRELWLGPNRPGGLEDSLHLLTRLGRRL